MKKLIGFLGGFILSYVGWFLGGGMDNMFLSLTLSTIFWGIGFYYGRKWGAQYD